MAPASRDDTLTDCKPTVSGTISLPSRGTFHHSLTVLFAIGRLDILSLTKWSSQIHAGLHGSGATRETRPEAAVFRVQDSYLLWWAVPEPFHYTAAW